MTSPRAINSSEDLCLFLLHVLFHTGPLNNLKPVSLVERWISVFGNNIMKTADEIPYFHCWSIFRPCSTRVYVMIVLFLGSR